MIWKTPSQKASVKTRLKESGNMILALFGAVALVGTLGAGTTMIVNGPVKVMSQVNQRTQTEGQILVSSKMVMLDVANLASNGDCDSDRLSEPREWRDSAGAGPDGVTDSNGGGFLPNSIGTPKRDGWGTEYGYCVWDHGAIVDNAGCGGATQNRLEGFNSIDHPVIAIISAGPNKTFETPCRDFTNADNNSDGDLEDSGDDPLITIGGDDLVTVYSYAEAAEDNPGLWSLDINTDGEAVAVMDGSINTVDFTGSTTAIGGTLELDGTEGLNIPDETVLMTCDMSTEGQMRRNMAASPPTLEICEDTGGAVYAWGSVATGSASSSGGDVTEQIADAVFDPLIGNCTNNAGGPLAEVGTIDPGTLTTIWSDGDYIYTGNGTNLLVYTFDGTDFTLIDSIVASTDSVSGVWNDGTYIYVSGKDGDTLNAYNFDGTTLSLAGSQTIATRATSVWGDGTYIYLGANNGGFYAYTFDGTTFTEKGSLNPGGNTGQIWGDGKYIYTSDQSLRAYSFDGETFVQLASYNPAGSNAWSWGDSEYIYVGSDTGLFAVSFDGDSFTEIATFPLTGIQRDIWSDGEYIYTARNYEGLYVFKFTGTSLIQVDHIDPNRSWGLHGDGSYIYTANHSSGIYAYSGYTCTQAYVPNIRENYIGQVTVNQTGSAGDTLGSAGWAQTLASDTDGDETGIAFVVGQNASRSSVPTAAITVKRENDTGDAGFVFKTRSSDGTINNRIYLASSGRFGINMTPTDSTAHFARLQIGDHSAGSWQSNLVKGLLVTSNESGTNQVGYFGFVDDTTDTNTILFSKALKVKQTNSTGSSLKEYIRFESTQATTFFGDIVVEGEAQTVSINNRSYSATDVSDSDLIFQRARINSSGNDDIVQDGDLIGEIKFQGFDGASMNEKGPKIAVKVDGTPASGSVPTSVSFEMIKTNFDPKVGNCSSNREGPLVKVGEIETVNSGPESVISFNNYIFSGNGLSGLDTVAHSFDGSSFKQLSATTTPDVSLDFWYEGNYLYVAGSNGGVQVYTFDGVSFNLIDSALTSNRIVSVWGEGNYIYASDKGSANFYALTFDGTSLSVAGTIPLLTADSGNIWGDGTYIYVYSLGNQSIYALTFDGTNFTLVANDFIGPSAGLWSDGDYIYTASDFGGVYSIRAHTFDGTTFTLVNQYNTTIQASDIWGDGTYIYAAVRTEGLLVLDFNGTSFSLKDQISTNNARAVWGDGQYIYLADTSGGLKAYSGFECISQVKADGAGNVGIQKSGTPEARMHVGGRILADEGIRLDNDTNCAAASDEGTVRYTGNVSEPYEVCDGSSWIGLSQAIRINNQSLLDCEPVPFNLLDITDATASTEYTSNGFIVGGLDSGEECYLSVTTDGSSVTIEKNGSDESSPITTVQNGDLIKLKVDSGASNSCVKTYASLGKQTDGFGLQVPNPNFFTQLDTFSTTDIALGVWSDSNYTYIADNIGGLRAYTFDGTTYTEVGFYITGNDSRNVWSDGTYIYLSETSSNGAIGAYTFDGTTFTELDYVDPLSIDNSYGVWGDGTYIYAATASTGLKAYTFDGTSFTEVGSFGGVFGIEVWSDGTYIYVADNGNGLFVFSFNGTTFTQIDSTSSIASVDVWGDGTYIYTADLTDGIRAYTFDGSTLTQVGIYNTPGNAQGIWGDGTYIYVADSFTGVRSYTFDGSTFTEVGVYNTSGSARKVWGDGTYIHVADITGGLSSYSIPSATLCTTDN
ncbi:MAG: hypothetical protein AAF988_00445 [Pseudomonadota bacterium]